MAKPKLAMYWAAGCGGCDVAVLDIHEKILDVAKIFDIVLWPIAMDFKYKDIRAMADKSIDLCLINGGVRTTEHEEIVKLLRAKSRVVVAFGACACHGGIPASSTGTNTPARPRARARTSDARGRPKAASTASSRWRTPEEADHSATSTAITAARVSEPVLALARSSGDEYPGRSDEPYRRALLAVQSRLAATYAALTGQAPPRALASGAVAYASPQELRADLARLTTRGIKVVGDESVSANAATPAAGADWTAASVTIEVVE